MNLYAKLLEREAAGKPVTVGVIGAGKFGTMFLSQARLTKGLHGVAVADLNVERARSQLNTAGWPEPAYAASSRDDAHAKRATFVTADGELRRRQRTAIQLPIRCQRQALQNDKRARHHVLG